jgi:hypothetical protein
LKLLDEEEKYPREKEEGPHNTSSLGLVATLQLFWGQDIWVVVVVVDVGVIYGFPSTSMYEGRLFVCLFCFVCGDEIHHARGDASDCVLGLFGKLSTRRGASA